MRQFVFATAVVVCHGDAYCTIKSADMLGFLPQVKYVDMYSKNSNIQIPKQYNFHFVPHTDSLDFLVTLVSIFNK